MFCSEALSISLTTTLTMLFVGVFAITVVIVLPAVSSTFPETKIGGLICGIAQHD